MSFEQWRFCAMRYHFINIKKKTNKKNDDCQRNGSVWTLQMFKTKASTNIAPFVRKTNKINGFEGKNVFFSCCGPYCFDWLSIGFVDVAGAISFTNKLCAVWSFFTLSKDFYRSEVQVNLLIIQLRNRFLYVFGMVWKCAKWGAQRQRTKLRIQKRCQTGKNYTN